MPVFALRRLALRARRIAGAIGATRAAILAAMPPIAADARVTKLGASAVGSGDGTRVGG